MNMIAKTKYAAAAIAISILMTLGITAAPQRASVIRDGEVYRGDVHLHDGTIYVRLREFAESLGATVTWDPENFCASVSDDGLNLIAHPGDQYITVNERVLGCADGVYILDGRTYVSLRAAGTAFGYDTSWDNDRFSAVLTREREAAQHADEYYDADDLYWLSRIIHAEAQGEIFNGKLAVATVVMNRVKSDAFPNNVYDVIFDRNGGVQFTPAANGTIYSLPDEDSIRAAKLALEGWSIDDNIMFFLNTDTAESFWITDNRQYVASIGNHDFYA